MKELSKLIDKLNVVKEDITRLKHEIYRLEDEISKKAFENSGYRFGQRFELYKKQYAIVGHDYSSSLPYFRILYAPIIKNGDISKRQPSILYSFEIKKCKFEDKD